MLELSQIFTYIAALAIAAAIPGPGMTALVARSVSSGALTGFAMLAGLILGDLTYLSFAVFGLAVLAKSFSVLFIIVKWGAVIYLLYLAWQFWTADHQSLNETNTPKRKDLFSACLSGYTITLGNPKTIAFYLALLPVIINLEMITIQSWAFILVPLTATVLLSVGAVFILGAIAVRHILSSKKAQKLLHRGAATTMVVAAGTMVARES
ncbi:LysE family translocator [Cocleimonas sp. KMM 6892]|jgi:threonine/homoserine/homoserine lactone efflux protein|uniref:LysE family translocator n=1 Tax=unclassified Cocleimonas TaxID=2639732 RepID=UPI002DBBA86A|nr:MULTISPECIES: LysE family translocator [unclassified Cocleimonas]MEB8434306.1 LysE family translocator [Cocleimonas sp. KMM 6892]MEC4717291.1 LysE family translocator [Cocleimonas sp. KMM 6895]MEC4746670.1 LysE family translocator [Cocleimonas sp. KMM 6896]